VLLSRQRGRLLGQLAQLQDECLVVIVAFEEVRVVSVVDIQHGFKVCLDAALVAVYGLPVFVDGDPVLV
jgi:hypothetical protein